MRNELKRLLPKIRAYQMLASKHGIRDIFQDNGGRFLPVALITGLTVVPNRNGSDLRDACCRKYELRFIHTERAKSISTHHHLNPVILAKYRKVGWVFAIYEGIELRSIYRLRASNWNHTSRSGSRSGTIPGAKTSIIRKSP